MSEIYRRLGITEEQARLFSIFNPFAFQQTLGAINVGQRFVYYTDADTAMKIIKNEEIWMRKSHSMNDYREIEHGFDCLNGAHKKYKDRLCAILDSVYPGFCERLETLFNGWLPHFRTNTYIACVSEHDVSEDKYGRLSMWRAYGRTAGVAIVFKGDAFFGPSDALKAYSSPVAYLSDLAFDTEYLRFLDSIKQNLDFIRLAGETTIRDYIFGAYRNAVLCTKHPGFSEEREWRVIYQPTFRLSERIQLEVESIGSVPQIVAKIPLKDVPHENLIGLNLPGSIERIIIGPSKYPAGIFDAFLQILTDLGADQSEAANKIIVSDLPLRQ
ncbi:DUF2971 domain-containing protein [Nitrobacter sp.]|uniref:DUF2971 domain-containing protein n=1 Tax=Nitrobacter sp. TaxID=29420 RepID=UPI003F64B099